MVVEKSGFFGHIRTMSKIAIVVGATGLVGSELVECLASTEHIGEVHTITRRPVKSESSKVQNHVVDFANLADYSELFKGDFLFSCLGTTKAQAKTIEAQRTVDLDYQYQAAQLASVNKVAHYLLVSSSGANPKSLSPYLKMKGELEQKVQSLGFKQVSVFQPSLLLGDRAESRFAEGVAARLMPALCRLPGLAKYRPISGREVALKMVEVSHRKDLTYQLYRLDDVFPLA